MARQANVTDRHDLDSRKNAEGKLRSSSAPRSISSDRQGLPRRKGASKGSEGASKGALKGASKGLLEGLREELLKGSEGPSKKALR